MPQNAIKCPKCSQVIKIPQKIVYNHMMAIKFRDRVQAIREAFVGIKRDLDVEKRSIDRIRSKSEKNTDEATCAIARMCGELNAMAGAFLNEDMYDKL